MGIFDFVTVTPKSKIFSKNSNIFSIFPMFELTKICIDVALEIEGVM